MQIAGDNPYPSTLQNPTEFKVQSLKYKSHAYGILWDGVRGHKPRPFRPGPSHRLLGSSSSSPRLVVPVVVGDGVDVHGVGVAVSAEVVFFAHLDPEGVVWFGRG